MKRSLFVCMFCALAACDDFDPEPGWLIAEPRLLAVSAQPPALEPGGSAALDALVVDAAGAQLDAPIDWRACNPWRFVLDPDIDCAPDASLPIDGVLSADDVLGRFEIPEGTSFEPPAPPDDDGCSAPPELELPVIAEAVVDGERLIAIKRIPLALSWGSVPGNPELADASIDRLAGGDGAYDVSVSVDPASLDMECRGGERVPEVIRVYVYATGGDLEEDRVDIVPEADGRVEPATLRWMGSPGATMWLVAMDRGGGTTWTHLPAE